MMIRQQGEISMKKPETFADLRDGVVSELEIGSPLTMISLSGDQRYGVVGGRNLVKVGTAGIREIYPKV